MMPSPADISLVRENKICPVPRSQETPWVFPACAPVCQHYYKPQVSLFKPLSSYQKYMCGISKSALFFHWCKHYFAWALHPEEGLLWRAGCPQSQAHKWDQIQSGRSEVCRWSDKKVGAGALQLHAKPQSFIHQSGNQQITELSGQETRTKRESHWSPHQYSLANPSLGIGLIWRKCGQVPPYSAGRRHTGLQEESYSSCKFVYYHRTCKAYITRIRGWSWKDK